VKEGSKAGRKEEKILKEESEDTERRKEGRVVGEGRKDTEGHKYIHIIHICV
jgi:hypothetical protein